MAGASSKHKCPVCGKYDFEYWNSMEYCDVCGWGDDAIQENDPDYKGGENRMSLKEARSAWEKGTPIQ